MRDGTRFEAEHELVQSDLPWYVNGSLAGEAVERLERHIAICAACRDELGMLDLVADSIAAETVVEQSPRSALDATLRRVDAFEQRRERAQRWRIVFERLQRRLRSSALPLAVAVQAIVILILVAMLVRPPAIAPPTYRTLTTTRAVERSALEVRIVLEDQMTLGRLRALLGQLDAEIAAGPTPTGVMTLRIGRDSTSGARPTETLETLRSLEGVTFAEVVSGDIPREE